MQGLTPPVLRDIVDELIEKEGVLLYLVYSSLAQEYKNTQPPGEPTGLAAHNGTIATQCVAHWAALRVASGASLVDEAAIRLGSRAAPSSKEEKQLARLAGQHKDISSRILSAQEAADSLRAAARLHGHVEEFDSLSAAGESMYHLTLGAVLTLSHPCSQASDKAPHCSILQASM